MYDDYIKKPSTSHATRGRPKRLYDIMTARFPGRTFETIDKVRDGEKRADFVRTAVENEIAKRRRAK